MKKSLAFLSALSFATAGFAAAPAEAPGLKVTGFLNYRYEWTENPRAIAEDTGNALPSGYGNAYVDAKSNNRLNMFLFLDNQFDGNTRFHAILGAEHLSGRTTNTNIQVKEAYVAAKFGPAEVQVGRFLSDVGLGTLGGAPFMDGIHLTVANKMVSAQVYVTKFGNANSTQVTDVADYYGYTGISEHMTFVSGDVKVMPVAGLTLSAAYFADATTEGDGNYKTYALGAEYKYVANNVPWFTVSGEYGKNNSDGAKTLNHDLVSGSADAPIAYYAKVKVLGAHPFMPGTGGISLQYRKAESGF
ncbi:MAG: S-layer y domain protein, partial [Holophagaceae bacterium]|nr:S-layer y domain protein [Holophagaceae bacterium]